MRKVYWVGSIAAAGLILLVGIAAVIAFSSPGCERTIVQKPRPIPPPVQPVDPLAPLRSEWNSESYPDWPVAELLAQMSNAAYLPPVNAKRVFSKLGFEGSETVEDTSMIGYVAWHRDVTVIAFRGTNTGDASDWVVNLNNRSISTTHGDMQRGFYTAYHALKPQIVELLEQSKPKHLWVTGHSLGGALALACAYDLINDQKRALDGIVTFGQPMVARRPLAVYLDSLLFGHYAHYVNEDDIVPKVPPGFAHCGSLVWFTKDGIRRSETKRFAAAAPGTAGKPTSETVDRDDRDILVPLTEEEFEQVKATLRTEKTLPKVSANGPNVAQFRISYFADHAMELYLTKVRDQRVNPKPAERK